MKPRALILRTAGTNCDVETARAFELAGAAAESLHLNSLVQDPAQLEQFQVLAIPGGFSYGDDIAAGRILANRLMQHLREELKRFVAAQKPVIGICNGFQVLLKTDLLPGPIAGIARPACTLANNRSGRFVDRWIHLSPQSRKCIWTEGLHPLELPVAHGEGRFVTASEAVRKNLWESDQIAFVYTLADGSRANGQFPDNPNGSTDDIAGICDASGLVLGLMPHPERFIAPEQHPGWTRMSNNLRHGNGLSMFANAIRHVSAAVGVGR